MRNFRYVGNAVYFTAQADIASGEGVLIGSLFGVAAASYAAGDEGVLNVTGIYELPKTGSQAWSFGTKVYWDDTNKRCTTGVTGNTLIGAAVQDIGGSAGETIGWVRLNGAVV